MQPNSRPEAPVSPRVRTEMVATFYAAKVKPVARRWTKFEIDQLISHLVKLRRENFGDPVNVPDHSIEAGLLTGITRDNPLPLRPRAISDPLSDPVATFDEEAKYRERIGQLLPWPDTERVSDTPTHDTAAVVFY